MYSNDCLDLNEEMRTAFLLVFLKDGFDDLD